MAIRWPWSRKTVKLYHGETLALPAPSHTSPMYEQHVGELNLVEANKRSSKAKGPQSLSMAWDDQILGISSTQTKEGLMSERDKKDTYYRAYIGNPWIRACVNVIGKRFTSGGWEVEPIEADKGNQANIDKIKELLLFVNDDEDFKQLLRSVSDDLNIFGEAFVEIVRGTGNLPVQLHKVDCVTMTAHYDEHGTVEYYEQSLERSTRIIRFEPDQIIRWWFADPRAQKKALSPIEAIKDAVYLYQQMTLWAERFFKQGGRPAFGIELAADSIDDDAKRYIKFFKENYLGATNAHVPPVLYSGSKMIEYGKGSVEMDFIVGRDKTRDEILAGYNVPLSLTGIQETAHLGGGTGEAADKVFLYNTVKPIEELILEKLNYRIVIDGFGITDCVITVRHADYRDDVSITEVQDKQIRNGSLTINEARQERGRRPVDGGDTPIVVASKDIQPVEILAEMAQEHRDQIDMQKQGAQAALDIQKNPPDEEPEPDKKQKERWDDRLFLAKATRERGESLPLSSYDWNLK